MALIFPCKEEIYRKRKTINLFFFVITFLLISAPLFSQSNEDCMVCHSDEELTMEKKGKEISLFVNESHIKNSAHLKLNCISCHTGFNPDDIPHKEKISPINCLTCHKDARVKHPFHPQLINSNGMNGSNDISCKGCHGTHQVDRVPKTVKGTSSLSQNQACIKCHKDANEQVLHSIHYAELEKGNKNAPSCITCHKQVISNKNGKRDPLVIKQAQEKLCLTCHLNNPDVKSKIASTDSFIEAYDNSVHGKALHGGNKDAANCVDCHNSHDILPGVDGNSSVHRLNVSQTCSKCHEDIAKEFNQSIHGMALAKRNMDAPACTNCHGEHNILKVKDPNSPVSFQNVSMKICADCHSSVRLSERYGLSSNRFQTFKDSYHGLALRGGSATVANCASCHGVHNIKPSSDSTSTIHKSNLVATCGNCHPGANENFTKGSVHVTLEKEDEPILYWIATIYIIMIFTIVGGMFFHNLLDFLRKGNRKHLIRRGIIKEEKHGHALYLRMTLSERIQHFSLMISFFVLVITGFMLRFPEAWWVKIIRDLSENAFEYRSLLHRISAVVMVTASLYHVYYLSFTARGKQLLKDLLPVWQDVKDAIGVMKYNLRFSNEKPKLGRFSYVEKAEYWALVWGTIVMTVTGVIMWFDNYFMGILTKLGWDISRTIHYYEAWLAFLSIVVWHIYFVIFNPDVYPMNLAWITGTLSEEEMAEEHPLELEAIKKAQKEAAEKGSAEVDLHTKENKENN